MIRNLLHITFLTIILITTNAWSGEDKVIKINIDTGDIGTEIQSEPVQHGRSFIHVVSNDITGTDRMINLGLVYTAQWVQYFALQWNTIMQDGSFQNWYSNMVQPHFDRDSYNYNLITHTYAGSLYYLFFRSRGYTKTETLLWAFISQLLFEFTIETITEKPSFQDMFQTPVLGALLGMTFEYLSGLLLSTDFIPAHILGYILNPFAMLPFSGYQLESQPIVGEENMGYKISFRF